MNLSNGKANTNSARSVEIPMETAQHTTAAPTLPPHSLLPTKALLRSFLVAAVSSHPFLLNPSLSILTFLSGQTSRLLSLEKNPILYALFKKTMYNHFCAGENGKEVGATIKGLKDMGYSGVILTYAREVVMDQSTQEGSGVGVQLIKDGTADVPAQTQDIFDADIEAWRQGVLETAGLIGENDFLALK
jgi:hypothetical protein